MSADTTLTKRRADVAVGLGGGFLAVWQGFEIVGRRLSSDGYPIGGDFEINLYSTSYQGRAAVTADPSGGFVVVWESLGSFGSDSSGSSIQGQLLGSNGQPVGSQFQVNSLTTGDQYEPSLAVDSTGTMIVVWNSEGLAPDTSETSVQGRRFRLPVVFTDGFESGDTSAWSQ